MPPLVLAALGAAGLYAAYRWFVSEEEHDASPPDDAHAAPAQRLVKDPATGIYLPEQRQPPTN